MNKKIYIYGCVAVVAVVLIIAAGLYVDKNTQINVGQAPDNPAPSVSSETGEVTKPGAAAPAANAPVSKYGKAPDFKAGGTWLNSQPLSIADLKGKVVLVDFWTYSCINCIRTLPYVTKWYDTYKDKGLVVIGVHTPEFTFEKDTNNVKDAMKRFGINYPVVQDNDYAVWNLYNNQYWPAEYLIDKNGNIVEEHFGEGDYDKSEQAIVKLLGMNTVIGKPSAAASGLVASPEMYFGLERIAYLTPSQQPSAAPQQYPPVTNLALNNFSVEGNWQFLSQSAKLASGVGKIRLKFYSGKLFMVASSPTPVELSIMVDGQPQPSVTVRESRLYTLFDSKDYREHVIEISVSQPGFEAFTFTFG